MQIAARLDINEALWDLGLLSREMLPEIAIAALTEEFDSSALRRLAASLPDEWGNEAAFARARQELGRPNCHKQEHLSNVAKWIAQNILSGTVDPLVGASQIWDCVRAIDDDSFHDLDPFIYAASEFEERPSEKALFGEMVRSAARVLLGER
jgi:hypothetical protein